MKKDKTNHILHIVNDEKFIVDTDLLFNEVLNFHHSYAVIGRKKPLKNIESLNVIFIHPVSVVLGLNLKRLKKYDAIIFHGLKGFKFNLLRRIEKKTPIAWIGWGYDYYKIINRSRHDFLLGETRSLIQGFEKQKKSFGKKFVQFFEPSLENKLFALKRIKLFNTVVKEDYYILKKALGNFIPEYIDWNYSILNKRLITEQEKIKGPSNNLIIGNSGSLTNNHLDAFNIIASSAFRDFEKVICPLSYGGKRNYIKAVIQRGTEIFKDKFQPLTQFYAAEEYFAILSSSGYYFAPNLRQQAFGNILLMIYLGKSVILFEENPIYRSLIQLDIAIFSAEDLNFNKVRELTLQEKEKNKKILMENFSESVLKIKSEKFLNKLVSIKKENF